MIPTEIRQTTGIKTTHNPQADENDGTIHRDSGAEVHAHMRCKENGRSMRDDTGAQNGRSQIASAREVKMETGGITERP